MPNGDKQHMETQTAQSVVKKFKEIKVQKGHCQINYQLTIYYHIFERFDLIAKHLLFKNVIIMPSE